MADAPIVSPATSTPSPAPPVSQTPAAAPAKQELPRPDIVKFPANYRAEEFIDLHIADQLRLLIDEFRPIFGIKPSDRVWFNAGRGGQAPMWLAHPEQFVQLEYPSGGSRSGQERHEWVDRGDGVFYGYLKDKPKS